METNIYGYVICIIDSLSLFLSLLRMNSECGFVQKFACFLWKLPHFQAPNLWLIRFQMAMQFT